MSDLTRYRENPNPECVLCRTEERHNQHVYNEYIEDDTLRDIADAWNDYKATMPSYKGGVDSWQHFAAVLDALTQEDTPRDDHNDDYSWLK